MGSTLTPGIVGRLVTVVFAGTASVQYYNTDVANPGDFAVWGDAHRPVHPDGPVIPGTSV